jgi:hypothetical protein
MSDVDQTEQLARLAQLKADAETAYEKMYNVYTEPEIRWQFELADESLSSAWRIAQELGMEEESTAIRIRHQHIRDVYRHQFRR